MSRPRPTRGLLMVAVAATLAGCIEAREGLEVTIDLSALTLPAAGPGDPMRDASGLADLSQFPLFIEARVEADDLAAPVVAIWPETVPDRAPDEVTLEIEVAAGQGRRLSVDLFLAEEGVPPALLVAPAPGAGPLVVDVAAGRVADVDVELAELSAATLRASWPAGIEVASIAWVEERARVLLPAVPAEGSSAEAELPAGRTYWPRVALADGSTLDLDGERVLVEAAGATTSLDLE